MNAPNIVLITVDDMGVSSVGGLGCPIPGITPNIDALMSEGTAFVNAHVAAAICMPSRQALMTGLYPHHNGGFKPVEKISRDTLQTLIDKDSVFDKLQLTDWEPVADNVPVLADILTEKGYNKYIVGKIKHLQPFEKYQWTMTGETESGNESSGRDPEFYYRKVKSFLAHTAKEGKPFFLMANSHDPHRPFPGSEDEIKKFGSKLPLRREYTADEAFVPGFLPGLPDVKTELAQYYGAVHRADETVGRVIAALKEEGVYENSLIMFLSDNGMAFPFSKTNCYFQSTRTPWIAVWKGKIKSGVINDKDFISGVDYLSTVCEAIGAKPPANQDGYSFLPMLTEGKPSVRRDMFTTINDTSARRTYPMRGIQDSRFGYIYNAWYREDRAVPFRNEAMSGLTFNAMKKAAETDKYVAERVDTYVYRSREELYDLQNDPNNISNLIDKPEYKEVAGRMRQRMREEMRRTSDPILGIFEKEI